MATRIVSKSPAVPRSLSAWLEEHVTKPSLARLLQVYNTAILPEPEGVFLWEVAGEKSVTLPYTLHPGEPNEFILEIRHAAWTVRLRVRNASTKHYRPKVYCPCGKQNPVSINEITGTATCFQCDWVRLEQEIDFRQVKQVTLYLRDRVKTCA